ncbi:MAG: hypothetical protein ACR2PS_09960 [Pseudomonadales bacterium]
MANSLGNEIKRESLVNGVMNTLFNGGIAWALLKGSEPLTLRSGADSYAIDLLATALILTFIVGLIVIAINRRKAKRENLPALQWQADNSLHALLQKMPHAAWASSLIFALFAMCVFAPLTIALLWAVGAESFTPLQYSIFKGCWAGLLAATMVGPMIIFARANPAPS